MPSTPATATATHALPAPPFLLRLSVGRYWSSDLVQECYEGIHKRLAFIFGVPGIVIFAVGIPLLSAWWLYRNRRRLQEVEFLKVYGTLYQVRVGAPRLQASHALL